MSNSNQNKSGFAGLIVLVSIVIIAILMMVQMSSIFDLKGSTGIDAYADRPWFEQDRLLSEEDFPVVQTGKGGRTVIEGDVKLTGSVSRNDAERGRVQIEILPSGKISGRWQCMYEYTKSTYTINAEFKGNIDPSKTYEDKNGKRKDLLYFIAKGKYHQAKTNKDTGKGSVFENVVYIVGWIENDYSTAGKIFLMTDEKSNSEYEWITDE